MNATVSATECQGSASGLHATSNSETQAFIAGCHPAVPYWGYAIVLAVVLPAVLLVPNRDVKEVVQLERLAPKIERAQTLSQETRDAVARLIDRQSAVAASHNQSLDIRRKAAIERVTGAMNGKREVASVGQGGDRLAGD